jgi:hypothetical protein
MFSRHAQGIQVYAQVLSARLRRQVRSDFAPTGPKPCIPFMTPVLITVRGSEGVTSNPQKPVWRDIWQSPRAIISSDPVPSPDRTVWLNGAYGVCTRRSRSRRHARMWSSGMPSRRKACRGIPPERTAMHRTSPPQAASTRVPIADVDHVYPRHWGRPEEGIEGFRIGLGVAALPCVGRGTPRQVHTRGMQPVGERRTVIRGA